MEMECLWIRIVGLLFLTILIVTYQGEGAVTDADPVTLSVTDADRVVATAQVPSITVSCADIHGDSFSHPDKPGVCYLFITDTKRYFLDARTKCQGLNDSLGWDVADVEDDIENKILQNAININTSDTNEFWIGQNDLETESVWQYVNSSSNACGASAYLNWESGQPNGDRTQNCMVYFYDGGNFQDRKCDDQHYTICKVKITSDTVPTCSPDFREDTSTDAPDECLDLWPFAFSNPSVPGVCYIGENNQKFSFQDALNFCSNLPNGPWSVADIEDEVENTFVEVWNRDNFPANNGYWIGQNDREQEYVWRYTASTQCPVYLNWDHQQPNGGRDQNCMVMLKKSSGRFQDKACNEKYYTLCKFKKDPGTPAPTSNCSSVDPQMEECTKLNANAFGSSVKPGICYYMSGYKFPWEKAVGECQNKGWSLIDVEDMTENDLLAARHRDFRPSNLNYWLGQNDRAVEGAWQYLNATPGCSGVFLNWDSSQPGQPNGDSEQNCIMMDKDGVWQDKACIDNYYVTCKKRTVEVATTTAPCTTPTPDECTLLGVANAFGITSKPGTCYQMSGSQMTWEAGVTFCQGKGWTLVDVEDEKENTELTEKYKELKPSYLQHWIGQNERQTAGSWQYLNATPGASGVYLHWASGQPNGAGTQNCIMMDIGQNGLWEDKTCIDSYYVTCKKQTATVSTEAPTTVQETTLATTTVQETTLATTTVQETTEATTTVQETTEPTTTMQETTEGATMMQETTEAATTSSTVSTEAPTTVQETTLATTKVQETTEATTTVQETTEPITTVQETTEPITTVQETTEPITTVQETTLATTTVQETTEPTTTMQETTEATTTVQETTEPTTTMQETTEGATTMQETTEAATTSFCCGEPNTKFGTFVFVSSDATCSSTAIATPYARDKIHCARNCLSQGSCFAFSFNTSGGEDACELCSTVSELKDLSFKAGGLFYQIV